MDERGARGEAAKEWNHEFHHERLYLAIAHDSADIARSLRALPLPLLQGGGWEGAAYIPVSTSFAPASVTAPVPADSIHFTVSVWFADAELTSIVNTSSHNPDWFVVVAV